MVCFLSCYSSIYTLLICIIPVFTYVTRGAQCDREMTSNLFLVVTVWHRVEKSRFDRPSRLHTCFHSEFNGDVQSVEYTSTCTLKPALRSHSIRKIGDCLRKMMVYSRLKQCKQLQNDLSAQPTFCICLVNTVKYHQNHCSFNTPYPQSPQCIAVMVSYGEFRFQNPI